MNSFFFRALSNFFSFKYGAGAPYIEKLARTPSVQQDALAVAETADRTAYMT